jgi:hypothetical protein
MQLADGMVFLPFQRAVGNSFLIQEAALKLSLLAPLTLMLDSLKNDAKPKTYGLWARATPPETFPGIQRNIDCRTSVFAAIGLTA